VLKLSNTVVKLYLKIHFVPRCKHVPSPSQFRTINVVLGNSCSLRVGGGGFRTEQRKVFCGLGVEFLNVTPGGWFKIKSKNYR
jgi:hypothetical protein